MKPKLNNCAMMTDDNKVTVAKDDKLPITKNQIFNPFKSNKPMIKDGDLGENPLAVGLRLTMTRIAHKVSNTEKSMSLNNDGTVDSTRVTAEGVLYHDAERDPKASFYTTHGNFSDILELSARGSKLLLYIMYELDYGKDYIWINIDRLRKHSGMSLNTYKGAVYDLSKLNFIYPVFDQRKYPYVFWINPNFIFKGSRLNKYKDAVDEYKVKGKRRIKN